MTPTARTLKLMRDDGWVAVVVERWNSFAHIRQDFAGFADVICFRPGDGILAVQVTTAGNVAARLAKIAAEPRAEIWRKAGGKIEVHGWAKTGERGKRKTWTLRQLEVNV